MGGPSPFKLGDLLFDLSDSVFVHYRVRVSVHIYSYPDQVYSNRMGGPSGRPRAAEPPPWVYAVWAGSSGILPMGE